MKNKSNSVKLYNVVFPFWMLILFPQMWLVVFPANFIIDSLVLLIAMFMLKVEDKRQLYKQSILKIFISGMLADVIGSAFALLAFYLLKGVAEDPTVIYITLPAVIISAALIFAANYFITFKKADPTLRLRLSLTFAIATAPYTFLTPIEWMY